MKSLDSIRIFYMYDSDAKNNQIKRSFLHDELEKINKEIQNNTQKKSHQEDQKNKIESIQELIKDSMSGPKNKKELDIDISDILDQYSFELRKEIKNGKIAKSELIQIFNDLSKHSGIGDAPKSTFQESHRFQVYLLKYLQNYATRNGLSLNLKSDQIEIQALSTKLHTLYREFYHHNSQEKFKKLKSNLDNNNYYLDSQNIDKIEKDIVKLKRKKNFYLSSFILANPLIKLSSFLIITVPYFLLSILKKYINNKSLTTIIPASLELASIPFIAILIILLVVNLDQKRKQISKEIAQKEIDLEIIQQKSEFLVLVSLYNETSFWNAAYIYKESDENKKILPWDTEEQRVTKSFEYLISEMERISKYTPQEKQNINYQLAELIKNANSIELKKKKLEEFSIQKDDNKSTKNKDCFYRQGQTFIKYIKLVSSVLLIFSQIISAALIIKPNLITFSLLGGIIGYAALSDFTFSFITLTLSIISLILSIKLQSDSKKNEQNSSEASPDELNAIKPQNSITKESDKSISIILKNNIDTVFMICATISSIVIRCISIAESAYQTPFILSSPMRVVLGFAWLAFTCYKATSIINDTMESEIDQAKATSVFAQDIELSHII